MNPTISDTLVSVPLTDISTAYIADSDQFIADKVFPIVNVDAQSALYFQYNKGDFFRVEVRERAPATESAGSGFDVSQSPVYYCRIYAVHKDLDDQTRRGAMSQFNLERASTLWVSQQLLLQRERVWANAYFRTGVWATDMAGVSGTPSGLQFKQWNDAASTPIEDITGAIITMAETTGYKPNTLVLSPRVLLALSNHPEIIDRVKYTQKAIITADILAALFGVDRIVTPWGIINSAAKGATDAFAFIYGKHALLVHSAPNPDLMMPSAGYIFAWTGYAGTGAYGNRVSSFRIEARKSDRIEGEMAYDARIISSDLGIFFNNAVA